MTHLREHMDEMYESLHVDLGTLAAEAQLEGGRLRRRNRLRSAAGGTFAMLAILGIGAGIVDLSRHDGRVREVTGLADASTNTESLTAMDALAAALHSVVPDISTSMRAEGGRTWLELTAPGDSSVTIAQARALPSTAAYAKGDGVPAPLCEGMAPPCEEATLPDGSLTRIASDPLQNGNHETGFAAARLLNGTAFLIYVIRFSDVDEVPLTKGQMQQVLEQPVWGQVAPEH
jgi:hypothetical protein